MTTHLNIKPALVLLSVTALVLLNSCCETCDIQLDENEINWLPYSDAERITFVEEKSGDILEFISGGIMVREESKDCDGIREKICHLTATQYLSPGDSGFGSIYRLEISKFKDGALLLSIQCITEDTGYEYLGLTSSSYNLDEDMIPSVDSMRIGNQVYFDIYTVSGSSDPVIPDEFNNIVEFSLTRNEGLIQFATKDGKNWLISAEPR